MTDEIAKQAADAERAAIVAWLRKISNESSNLAKEFEARGYQNESVRRNATAIALGCAANDIGRNEHHKGSK